MAAHVLVVEDEPDIRDLVVFHLEREGYRTRAARSGADALRQVRMAPPDLIVLDLMLPEIDGLEVCRRLRGNPATAAIPVIMLTARGEEVDRVVGLELGADDYVTKPFSPNRAGEVESRTVDVHVRRLRQKLGREGCRILTVKSAGYRFEEV